jgi:outer membrane protein TolC
MLINKLRKSFITAILFSFLFTCPGKAQEKRHLSLEESLKIGLENSKILHSSKMKIISADAQLSMANAGGLPSLALGANYTRLSNVAPYTISIPYFGTYTLSPTILDNYTAKLSLQQPLFTGFKISSNSEIAKNNSLAAKQDYSKDEQDVIYNIKNAYWNLFLTGKLKEAIDENVQQMKAHLDDIQNFFKQGLATKNEVLKVEVQLSEAQLSQIDARNSVKIATVNFDNVINISLATEIEVQEDAEVENENIEDIDQLIDKAMKNRPDLKSLQYRLNASKNGITLAQSGWYPQVVIGGEYDYEKPNSRILPLEDNFKATWAVEVGLTYSLWDWGTTRAQTTQAESQYEQTKDSYSTLKDAVTLDVTQNYYNLVKAKEKVLVTEQTVNQAEENYRVTDERFKQGLTLNSELLDAEVALVQAKTNCAQSIVDYELAKAQIERSTGGK